MNEKAKGIYVFERYYFMMTFVTINEVKSYISNFRFQEKFHDANPSGEKKSIETILINGKEYPRFVNEFWTSKQRKGNAIHEISYRACYKPQLPRFFINCLSKPHDVIYDPFSGRGTTVIEAALMNREIISNDINPLSRILTEPRLFIPTIDEIKKRLEDIPSENQIEPDIDLSMFYHKKTEKEIVSLKAYLHERYELGTEDDVDRWIRMVATNRLTGHSSGFFSVYTLPPNQAVSQESQIKINKKRNQIPPYRNTKEIIIKKSKSLLRNISSEKITLLRNIGKNALFISEDARSTHQIPNNYVDLTITSPPFLNIVQYSKDNWLRCWFNSINPKEIEKKITMSKTIKDWTNVMETVFKELYRITKVGGWVAFEVGEVHNGKTKLDEYVVPLGEKVGFTCANILINSQVFTKTSNIWGVKNMDRGTNTNRIVMFKKEG